MYLCICVFCGFDFASFSKIFLMDFRTFPTVWYFKFFILVLF